MKAAVYYGKHDIRVEEKNIRAPEADEVVVKVAFCGICGTDSHIFHGDEGSVEIIPPAVIGHELSGVVTETGRNVTMLSAGDHVAIDPNLYCGLCHYCRSGQEHFCSAMRNPEGGFAEYCTVPAKAAVKIPKGIPLIDAAFAEPVACCLHGTDLTGVRAGDHVLILGQGTIGLIMTQLVKLSGASVITVIEPDDKKRAMGVKFGASNGFSCMEDYYAYARSQPDLRADKVFECVGKVVTVSSAIQAATKGATVMLFGLTPPKAAVTVYPFEIFRKELRITSSFVNPLTQSRAIDLLHAKKISVAELVSERIPLERLSETLMNASSSKMKIMVEMDGGARA